jgi:hypothetical protein
MFNRTDPTCGTHSLQTFHKRFDGVSSAKRRRSERRGSPAVRCGTRQTVNSESERSNTAPERWRSRQSFSLNRHEAAAPHLADRSMPAEGKKLNAHASVDVAAVEWRVNVGLGKSKWPTGLSNWTRWVLDAEARKKKPNSCWRLNLLSASTVPRSTCRKNPRIVSSTSSNGITLR